MKYGKKTRDTRDTRAHKGTRTAQTNLTTIQTHQQHTPRTSEPDPASTVPVGGSSKLSSSLIVGQVTSNQVKSEVT